MKAYSFMALLLALLAFNAQATVIDHKKVLISVGDLKDNKSKEWKKSTCLQVYKLANEIVGNGVDVTCREFDTKNFSDEELGKLYGSYDYHLRIMRLQGNDVSADVTKWKRQHETDFKTLGWTFKDVKKSKVTKEQTFDKVMGNLFFYVGNEEAYKAGLLVNGAFESYEIYYDKQENIFRDKHTNEPISVEKAYTLFEQEGPRKKNYLRTGIEIGVQLSAALAIYYNNLVFNKVDFDYSLKSGLKEKFITGSAMKFDDNDKRSNYGHELAGVLYYQTARSNGFNSLESALIGFAASAAWETLEYHEIFSLNDQIMTPIGGYVIGEAGYQIACALLQKNSLVAKALAYTVAPALGANHAIDAIANKNKYASQPDCKKPRWSDISAYIGLDRGQKAYQAKKTNDYILGMQAEVVTIEGFNKEGQTKKMVYDTAMVKALVEANGNESLVDLKIVAQVVAAAYNQKNITKDDKGELRGYDVILGVGSASTWTDRGSYEKTVNEDFYGTVNILGATAHANIHYNGFEIRADFGMYGDFAMVKSYSLQPLKDSRDGSLADQNSLIQRKGYYWGAGASAIAAISISKGRFEVGYDGQLSGAKSINERNRVESTSGDTFRDNLNHNKVYVSFSLTKNLKLQLSREYNRRQGSVNNQLKTSGTEVRTMGTLVYKF